MEPVCRNRGICLGNRSLRTLLLIAWLGLWIQQTSGADAITAAVGETVNITAQFSGTINSYTWYRGTVALGDQIILTYIEASRLQRPGPQYTDREMGLADGSLRIRDVLTNYTGNYTAIILTQDGTSVTVTKQLRVYGKVPKPIVRINVSQPIENQLVVLTCENSNAATTILWFFNNKTLQPDNNRLTLSSDNRTVTISRISRSDDGSYQCEAENPVSRNTSDPLTVTVSYGPDIPIITPSQNVEFKLGNELHLTCTAASYPDAQYQWWHNNTNINNPQSTYTKARSTYNDSGTYTCVASNSRTGLSANVSVNIKISESGPPSPGIGGGTIAGIVIAVVVVLIVIGVIIWYFCFKQPASGAQKGDQTEMNGAPAASNLNAAASGKANGPAEDVQYTTVKFEPKTNKATAAAAPEGTVYSEVRRK